MTDLFTNPAVIASAASLGIGLPILVLFATGRLPTPAERATLLNTIDIMRKAHEAEIDKLVLSHEKELESVRSNLRDDVAVQRAQLEDREKYLRQLVDSIFAQQKSVQQDVVPPLATLAQQLPTFTYLLQEEIRKRDGRGA